MAIDASILAGIKPVSPTPYSTLAQNAAQTENTLSIARQRIQQAKDLAATNAALQQAQGDLPSAIDYLNKNGSGTAAMALQTRWDAQRKSASEQTTADIKNTQSILDISGSMVDHVKQNPTLQNYQALQKGLYGLAQGNPQAQNALRVIAPDLTDESQIGSVIDGISKSGLSQKDRLDQALKAQEYFEGQNYRQFISTGLLAAGPNPQARQGFLQHAQQQGTPNAVLQSAQGLIGADEDTIRQFGMSPEQITAEQKPVSVSPGASLVAPSGPNVGKPIYTAPEKDVFEAKSVLLDGKPAEVRFNARTGRYTDAAGNDVSARVTPIPPAAALSIAQTSDVADTVRGMRDGLIPPVLPARGSKEYIALTGEATRQGVNLSKLNEDWTATQRYLSTLNGVQQTRLRQAIAFTSESIPNLRNLITQWDSKGLPLLSKANLDAAASGALGNDAQSLAVRLRGQVADLTSELGTVYKGGNSSTDESLKLAAQNLQGDWSKKAALAALDQIEQNITVRQHSMQNVPPVTNQGNQYEPTTGTGGQKPSDVKAAASVPKEIAAFLSQPNRPAGTYGPFYDEKGVAHSYAKAADGKVTEVKK